MKKSIFMSYLLSAIILLFGFLNTDELDTPPNSFINSIEDDISGDGIREYLKLQGELISKDSEFYQNVWLDITNTFSEEWTISLKGGYKPDLNLYDLNQDGVNDIIYQVALDEEKEHFATQVYTLTNNKVNQLTLPINNQIKGEYVNDFKIAFTFHTNDKPLYFDIENKRKLIDNKLYNHKGELKQDVPLSIDSIKKYIPVLISESKEYGLKSVQDVRDNNDVIGSIETLWHYNKDKWIIIENEWLPH